MVQFVDLEFFTGESAVFFEATDDELMQKIANGQDSAFRTLFDRHVSRVLGYCTRFMGDKSRGEDAAQEVWMKIIRAAPSYRGEGKFSAWILTIARTTCLTHLRGAGREEVPLADNGEDLAVDETQASIEQTLTLGQDVARLKKEIDALPDMQRAVLVQWMTHESTYEEIAREMDLTVPAVKSLLFRAKQALERNLRGSL